jgi:hypothetical protein
MKRSIYICIALLLLVNPCNSQPDTAYQFVIEEMPSVEGGRDAFMSWIDENNRLKNISDTLTEDDKVYVMYSVDTTGLLSDIMVVRGLAPPYDKEAYRLIKSCPLIWSPGKKQGKKVVVTFTMPISFYEAEHKSNKK